MEGVMEARLLGKHGSHLREHWVSHRGLPDATRKHRHTRWHE